MYSNVKHDIILKAFNSKSGHKVTSQLQWHLMKLEMYCIGNFWKGKRSCVREKTFTNERGKDEEGDSTWNTEIKLREIGYITKTEVSIDLK